MSVYVFPPAPVAAGAATEITLLQVEQNTADTVTELQTANISLANIDGKDFATETTLQAVLADTSALDAKDFATETTLASLDSKDFSTETTLQAVLADTTSLDSKDFATETTLAALAAEDFATQTTLAALSAKSAGSLVPEAFDYQALTYVLAGNGVGEVETVVYKTGGSGGSTVATITLAYDASNRVSSVTRS